MAKAGVEASLKLKAIIANEYMIAFTVPLSDQSCSGLERYRMHVPGLAGSLDALAEVLDLTFGSTSQATMYTFLQAVSDPSSEQVRSDIRCRRSEHIAQADRSWAGGMAMSSAN
ncbi:hypothetical protein [Parasphingorhabdus sp.]